MNELPCVSPTSNDNSKAHDMSGHLLTYMHPVSFGVSAAVSPVSRFLSVSGGCHIAGRLGWTLMLQSRGVCRRSRPADAARRHLSAAAAAVEPAPAAPRCRRRLPCRSSCRLTPFCYPPVQGCWTRCVTPTPHTEWQIAGSFKFRPCLLCLVSKPSTSKSRSRVPPLCPFPTPY